MKSSSLKLVIANCLVLFSVFFSYGQTWELEQCIDTALVNNKKLEISRNNVLIGEIRTKEAKANLIPKLTLNGEYKYYTDLPTQLLPLSVFGGPEGQFKEARFGVPHNINANVQLAIPVYNSQIYGAIKSTQIASELSTIQYQKNEEEIIMEVSSLYYNGQIVLSQIAFIDSNIVNVSQLLKNVELAKNQLLANGIDVDRVTLQLDQLAFKKMKLESNYEQIVNGLKFIMGLPLSSVVEINPAIQFSKAKQYEFQQSLEVAMIQMQNRLLTNELLSLKRTRLPSVSLFGSYGTLGYGYDKQPNQFLNFYTLGLVGLQVNYTLFNGTVTHRKIQQKNLELDNSLQQIKLVEDKNEMLVANARLEINVAQKLVETSRLQVNLAQSIFDNTELQRQHDLASLNDVLLANSALKEAQQNYLSAIVDYLKADLNLKNLTGNSLK